jgi:hypothetical protein
MPHWCIGIHGSNPYKLNTLAMPFYSVIPLTRIPSALLVAKLLKMEQETVLEPDEAFNFSAVGYPALGNCGTIAMLFLRCSTAAPSGDQPAKEMPPRQSTRNVFPRRMRHRAACLVSSSTFGRAL